MWQDQPAGVETNWQDKRAEEENIYIYRSFLSIWCPTLLDVTFTGSSSSSVT
jgi:hypothetical protein